MAARPGAGAAAGAAAHAGDGDSSSDGGPLPQQQLQLTDLPDAALTSILACLDGPSLAGALSTCSRLRAVAADSFLWRRLLWSAFGLRVGPGAAAGAASAGGALSSSAAQREYVRLYQRLRGAARLGNTAGPSPPPAPPALVQLKALLTDGGCDSEGPRYWVQNLFTPDEHSCYCSVRSFNVHVLAYVAPPAAAARAAAAVEAARERRAYIIARCAPMAAALWGHGDEDDDDEDMGGPEEGDDEEQPFGAAPDARLTHWGLRDLEDFFVQAVAAHAAGLPLGTLMTRDVPAARRPAELARMRAIDAAIRRERETEGVPFEAAAAGGPAAEAPAAVGAAPPAAGPAAAGPAAAAAGGGTRGLMHLFAAPEPDAAAAAASSAAGPPAPAVATGVFTELAVSRRGAFSCPVACGAVFVADTPPGGALPSRARQLALSQSPVLCALDDVTDFATLQSVVAEGRLGRGVEIADVITNPGGTTVEFRTRGDPDAALRGASAGGVGGAGSAAAGGGPGSGELTEAEADPWRPVAWFLFRPKAEARRMQTQALAAGLGGPLAGPLGPTYDRLRVPLRSGHAGGLVGITLIAPENRMAAMQDDHAEANIDCGYVCLQGDTARLP